MPRASLHEITPFFRIFRQHVPRRENDITYVPIFHASLLGLSGCDTFEPGMFRRFLVLVAPVAALITYSTACTGYRTEDVYVRARPGSHVSASPSRAGPAPGAEFRVVVADDGGVLKKIDVKPGGGPFVLPLDEWAGMFLKISFQAGGEGVSWNDIRVKNRAVGKTGPKGAAPRKGGSPPNVIIYLVDALRADALGCYNPESRATPHIDSFARTGVLFERAYSPASWTRASVASLFTGSYPPFHGAVGRRGFLGAKPDTLARALKKAGYRTEGYVTNGNVAGELGFDRGFDRYVYFPENPQEADVYSSSESLLARIGPALEKLEQPFFLYIHQSDPHAPYTPPPGLAGKFIPSGARPISGGMEVFRKLVYRAVTPSRAQVEYLRGLYRAEVAAADAGFGKFLRMLEANGFYGNSIVFFISDHGEEFYRHKGFGHGGTLYEEQVRVPLIVRYPGGSPAGRAKTPVSLVDIPPSLLDYLGLKRPEGMRGGNLEALAETGGSPPPWPLYMHEVLDKVEKEAVLDWPMKLVHNVNRTNQWGDRVVEWEMYDLGRDPLEQRPLSMGRKIVRRVLEDELARLRSECSPPSVGGKVRMSGELRRRLEALGY